MDDQDVDKILLVMQTPHYLRKHPGGDRTGDHTKRSKVTAEMSKAINDGLLLYEQDLQTGGSSLVSGGLRPQPVCSRAMLPLPWGPCAIIDPCFQCWSLCCWCVRVGVLSTGNGYGGCCCCCCCRPHSTNVLPAESSTRNHVAASSLSPQVARKGSTLSGFVQRSRLEREVGRDLHSNKWEEV